MRAWEIAKFKSSLDRVQEAQEIFPPDTGLTFRYIIFPNSTLPGSGLDFKPDEMEQMVQIGKDDAARVRADTTNLTFCHLKSIPVLSPTEAKCSPCNFIPLFTPHFFLFFFPLPPFSSLPRLLLP